MQNIFMVTGQTYKIKRGYDIENKTTYSNDSIHAFSCQYDNR